MRELLDRGGRLVVHIANRPRLIAATLAGNWLACALLHMTIENRWNPGSSMWWALVFVGTQGTRDAVTLGGRLVGAWLILTSVFFFVPVITASITSRLIVNRDAFTHEEQASIQAMLVQLCERADIDPVEASEIRE